MKLFNSLTKKIEEVESLDDAQDRLGVYTCGPTVYSTATIGNFRTYVLSDLLVRTLKYLDYPVKHVMNLTDVGHLTGDNEGDADQGEDRLEKAARKEGRDAWEISQDYAAEFVRHMGELNIVMPNELCKATEHISEQIELVEKLEKKGLTYRISDGIYFDVEEYEKEGNKYGELSNLDQIKEGARVEVNPEKRGKRDFALWKFSPSAHSVDSGQASSGQVQKRQMEWESPWGVGFPGWHVECSAMSMKYLGEQFAIHVGGEDLRSTHHPNEIAQSEGATGKKPFVKIWVHGAFLQVDGGRMGKSLGNAYTLEDIKSRGIDPLALRYFYLTGSYRKQLNFTWEALEAANTALTRLRKIYQACMSDQGRKVLSEEKLEKVGQYGEDFVERISSDLDMPGALAVVWEVAKSNIPSYDKAELMRDFDRVLGIGLVDGKWQMANGEIPEEVKKMMERRVELRKNKQWEEADKIRDEIVKRGYEVNDQVV